MRKSLIAAIFSTVLALGYLTVTAMASAAPPCGTGQPGDPAFGTQACTDCLHTQNNAGLVCIGWPAHPVGPCTGDAKTPQDTGLGGQACEACVKANANNSPAQVCIGFPGARSAAPPVQDPFEQAQPHNGCFVASTTTTSNLLKECPNYTCASIIDDQIRDECNSLGSDSQKELLNLVGHNNPTGLNPMPLNAAGNVPTPPDTGPCAGSSMPTTCNALLGIADWASYELEKNFPRPPPADKPGSSSGIRG
jgi:hypothetical protein